MGETDPFKCSHCGKIIKWYPDHTWRDYHLKGLCVWPHGFKVFQDTCKSCGKTTDVIEIEPMYLRPGGKFCRECLEGIVKETSAAMKKGIGLFPEEKEEDEEDE